MAINTKRRYISLIAWLITTFLLASSTSVLCQDTPQPPLKADDGKFGIGMVPKMDGGYFFWDATTNADNIERMLYRTVGDIPEVDRLYVINDSEHLLQTLVKLKKAGRKVDYLVLAGHGSRDTPGLKWGKDDMTPEELDLEWNRVQLRVAEGLVKDPSKSTMTPAEIRQRRNELAARVILLESAGDTFAPNATVLLINCSAAATEKGQQYVKAMGQSFLGKNGGSITASRKDIKLYEADWWLKGIGFLIRQWRIPSWNETLVWGDWVTTRIAPASARRWELAETIVDPDKKNGRHESKNGSGEVVSSDTYAFSTTALAIQGTRLERKWDANITWKLPQTIIDKVDNRFEIEMSASVPSNIHWAFNVFVVPYVTEYQRCTIEIVDVWHDGAAHVAYPDISSAGLADSRINPTVGWAKMDPELNPLRAALGHEVINTSKAIYEVFPSGALPEFNIALHASGCGLADTPMIVAKYRLMKALPPPPSAATPPKTLKPAANLAAPVPPKPAAGKIAPKGKTAASAPKPAKPVANKIGSKTAEADIGREVASSTTVQATSSNKQLPTEFGTWSATKMEIKALVTTIELKDGVWRATKLPGPIMEIGSELLSVDGLVVAGQTPEEIRDLIIGPKGRQVKFIFREPKSGRLMTTGYVRK